MIDPARAALILYTLFWMIRMNGCIRRGRQPLLRGREWFFSVHVPPNFYEAEGKKLLRHYWVRMIVPLAIDIPIAVAIIASGRFVLLNGLVVGQGALIHANHFFSVRLAERQARRFALDEPVAAVVASLTPRRLRQYTNWRLELVLTVTLISAMIWRHEHVKVLAILLYVQIGLVYVKHVIVAWRSPVPREQAEEHIAVQEAKRKYYLATIDWARALLTVQVLVWSAPFAVWLVITIVGTIAVEVKRKQLVRIALRARPVIMPALMKPAQRPLYYERSAAVIGIAYLAGFIVLGHAL